MTLDDKDSLIIFYIILLHLHSNSSESKVRIEYNAAGVTIPLKPPLRPGGRWYYSVSPEETHIWLALVFCVEW